MKRARMMSKNEIMLPTYSLKSNNIQYTYFHLQEYNGNIPPQMQHLLNESLHELYIL